MDITGPIPNLTEVNEKTPTDFNSLGRGLICSDENLFSSVL